MINVHIMRNDKLLVAMETMQPIKQIKHAQQIISRRMFFLRFFFFNCCCFSFSMRSNSKRLSFSN